MSEITEFFNNIMDTSGWPPRWHCGHWTSFHGWLYIIAELLIWLAYFGIPLLIIRMILKRKDLPFPRIFWLFGAFILLCGTSHLMDAIIFWWPAYRLSALIRVFTAIVSVTTFFMLIKIVPKAFMLKTPAELQNEIDERKKAEVEVKSLNAQLLQQVNYLQEFSYITSHNLRSHVSNLSGLLMLDEHADNSLKQEIMANIKTVTNNLDTTLNHVATVLNIRNNTNIKKEDVYFERVLNKVIAILATEIKDKQAIIKSDFSACPNVSYSGIYMQSTFLNLLSNALKYSKNHVPPVIELTSAEVDGECSLTITDNGSGIDLDKNADKMFMLYKTFHNNQDALGVGLFTVKAQVETLGGYITVNSEPEKGSSFKIVFNARHPETATAL